MVAVLHVGMPLGFCEKYFADIVRIAVPFFINPICYSTICIFS